MQTFDAILTATMRHLDALSADLAAYLGKRPNQRAELLGRAFAQQLDDLHSTVTRIVARAPTRALKRPLRVTDTPAAGPLRPEDDSRALTAWLVGHLQAEHIAYQHHLDHSRLGPAKDAVSELAALFVAQSKRIALEAHRFQDL